MVLEFSELGSDVLAVGYLNGERVASIEEFSYKVLISVPPFLNLVQDLELVSLGLVRSEILIVVSGRLLYEVHVGAELETNNSQELKVSSHAETLSALVCVLEESDSIGESLVGEVADLFGVVRLNESLVDVFNLVLDEGEVLKLVVKL